MDREQIEGVLLGKKNSIKEEKTLNIGIDTGFGNGVASWEDGKLLIPSYIREIRKREALENSKMIKEENIKNGKELIVRYIERAEEGNLNVKEKYFYVGNINFKKDRNARRLLTTKRVGNLKYLIQILTLIGVATDEEEINVNLSMGLPVKMKGEADALKKWLIGKYEIAFLCGGEEVVRKIKIEKVLVLPQALAPVFSLGDKYIGKRIVSVDLGHYTNDMCFWTGRTTDINKDYCGNGFYLCYKEMETLLLEDSNITELTTSLHETYIQEALEKGKFTLYNFENDVKEYQEEILESYAIDVVETIATNYETVFDFMDFLLLSGGIIENKEFVNMIIEEIEKYKIKIIIPEEPQYAVAKGLYKFLKKVIKSKK